MGEAAASKRYVTTGQAAASLGLTRHTLVRAVQRGELRPALRTPGGRYRFTPETIAAYGQILKGEARPGTDALPPPPTAVYDALACGVVVQDAAGRIVYANAAAALLGIAHDQLLGRTSRDPRWQALRADGTSCPATEHPAMVALRAGQPQRGVTMGVAVPSGGYCWLQVDAVPTSTPDADGISGVVVSFTDISARVEAATLLRRAYDALASGVMMLDTEGRVLAANAAAEEILGARLEDLHGDARALARWEVQRPTGEPLAPEERPGAIAMHTQRPVRGERVRLRRPDGRVRHLQVDAVPLRDTSGHVERVVVSYVDLTARVKAEEERDRFFALAQDPMCVADFAGHFVRVNPAFAATLGWTAAELLARPIVDFIHPDDRAATEAEGARQWSGAPTVQFENRYRHKDGSWRWFSWNVTPVPDEGLTYAVARDVTERRAMEDALHQSEERFRLVFDEAPTGIALAAPDGRVLEVNPALGQMLGYREHELLEQGTPVLTHPDDIAASHALIGRLLAGEGETATLEKRYLHRDGHVVWTQYSATLVRDAAGQPLYFIYHLQDITARKAAVETQARLAAIVDGSEDAIVSKTLDGTITSWNAGAARLYGYTAQEALGRPITLLAPPERADEVPGLLARLRRGEHIRHFETVRRHKDGHAVPVSVTLSPITDGSGTVIGAATIARDITERQRAEEALRRAEERYRSLLEVAPDAIVTCGAEGRIVLVNGQAERLFGYARDELIGQAVDLLLPEHRRALHATHRAAYLAHPHTRLMGQGLELFARTKEGRTVPVEISLSPLTHGSERLVTAVIRDITVRKQEEEHLRHTAHHDALTGLPNRALFADRLAVALAAAARHAEPLAVLLLDLDRFKWVNDTLGHAAGDALLRVVAERLRAALRAEDTVARLGGDEFAVILPGADEHGALVAAEKLLSALAAPVLLDDRPVDMGGSIGIALSPTHGVDQASLLRCADVAMYQAKRAHLGRTLYVAERDDHTPERLSLSAELRRAMTDGQLVLHYQPVLDLASNTVCSVEALVRWSHPTRGLLLPGDFLPVAEETGLSAPLTSWVLKEAVRQCRAWQDAGLAIGVGVNLAGAALRDVELVQHVRTILEDQAVPATCLMLEMTEHVAMADPERTIAQVSALHDVGLQVALDDVGTGQSSLAYLQRLPVDALKIDRRFAAALAVEESGAIGVSGAATMIAFLQGLGRALGRTVVVKGIEEETQRLALAALGCDAAQGYAIAPPLPAADIPHWLHRFAKQAQALPSPNRRA